MHCWTRYLFVVVSVLSIGQMISACGQKGDLYLPEPEQEVSKTKATGAETGSAARNAAGDEPVEANGAAAASKGTQRGQQ
ncbi:MAG: lipoprotein [Chromatiaceae bacterium]|jgi:predicted small lipoprotein YifL|nr:lipoprotein [Chromatiaceae bacterium]